MKAVFVDTSILCNLLPVPGLCQDRDEVVQEYKRLVESKAIMVLPISSVIETGNHISHLADGAARREAAQKFAQVLRLVRDGTAPWIPHELSWDRSYIERLIDGDSTRVDMVELSMMGIGTGDLSILVERDLYRSRSRLNDVAIWTKDAQLSAYA